MSKSVITDSLLTAIADAIRAKTGGSGQMTPAEMAQKIADIPQGANEPYIEYGLRSAAMYGFDHVPSYQFYQQAVNEVDFAGSPNCSYFGDYAFSFAGTENPVYTVTVPVHVTELATHCYERARYAGYVLHDNISYIGDYCFANSKFSNRTLPAAIRKVYPHTFEACTSLTEISLRSGITEIGEAAYKGCNKLASVSLPSDLVTMGAEVFSGCSALTGIVIPDTVTSMGNYAFNNCSKLASVILSSALTAIPQAAFSGCTVLQSIDIPASVTSIAGNVFYNCQGMADAIIRGTVNVNAYAFWNCKGLKTVRFLQTATAIATNAFQADTAITDIYVPWSLGDVAGAPWGATNATIHYDTQYDANGNVIS